MNPSTNARNHFRHIADPDDARDLAFDFDADRDAQYDAYVERCHEAGEVPLPR